MSLANRNRSFNPPEIPKKIHFIWLGDKPMPKIADKCINSWKTIMPDYEVKIWNDWDESLLGTEFKDVYDYLKVYAFKSDVLRVAIINKIGGIYSDIDLELIRDIRPYIKYMNFFGGMYRFSTKFANTPLGGIPNHFISRTILTSMRDLKNKNLMNRPAWTYYATERVLETYKPAYIGTFSEQIPVEGDFMVHYSQHDRTQEIT